jgi:DNA-directed RNA polymerase subunit delta
MAKKRIVKDYNDLPEEVLNQVKLEYPEGFSQNLVTYTNSEGRIVSALPFDTSEIYYLIRMTEEEAERIIEEDDDYDDEGNLRDDFNLDEIDADAFPDEDSSVEDED